MLSIASSIQVVDSVNIFRIPSLFAILNSNYAERPSNAVLQKNHKYYIDFIVGINGRELKSNWHVENYMKRFLSKLLHC